MTETWERLETYHGKQKQYLEWAVQKGKENGFLTITPGNNPTEWSLWKAWREKHGLPVGLMDREVPLTVPCRLPPDGFPSAEETAAKAKQKLKAL